MPARRELLQQIFAAAVAAAHGETLIERGSRVCGERWFLATGSGVVDLPLPQHPGRLIVAGAGKAAASLARGVEHVLGDRIDAGVVIVKHGHCEPLRRIRCHEGGHPVPDAAAWIATRGLLELLDATRIDDVVLFLLTGGASSLLCSPVEGISLADKIETQRLLVNSGASIHEINAVRRCLSSVKGGQLRARARARTCWTLAISDVVDDDRATIGSGPTVNVRACPEEALCVLERYGLERRLPETVLNHLRHGESRTLDPAIFDADLYQVLAGNQIALKAAAQFAADRGFEVELCEEPLRGNTHSAARRFAQGIRERAQQRSADAAPLVVLAGGETTLEVRGAGHGGRSQEFALRSGQILAGLDNVHLLAAGTDGTDGPTDAAGAFADGEMVARARAQDIDIDAFLARNDAYAALDATGDLFRPGPTGTNVMDVVIALIG